MTKESIKDLVNLVKSANWILVNAKGRSNRGIRTHAKFIGSKVREIIVREPWGESDQSGECRCDEALDIQCAKCLKAELGRQPSTKRI